MLFCQHVCQVINGSWGDSYKPLMPGLARHMVIGGSALLFAIHQDRIRPPGDGLEGRGGPVHGETQSPQRAQ